MLQMSLQGVSHAFGGAPLLQNITFQIHKGERISLIGRNGSGKTTLLRLIQNEFPPDTGVISISHEVSISTLPQDISEEIDGTLFDVVAEGLGDEGKLLADYHKITARLSSAENPELTADLSKIQHKLDVSGGWDFQKKVDKILSKMGMDPEALFPRQSTGLKRRALLARSLVSDPDVLLLDEPTNHLDIESIEWMEDFFSSYRGTLVFVTHDRLFLRKLATRIVELDRGGLFDWSCDYNTFLGRKEALLNDEAKVNSLFDKKLADEEVWIRRGIKARRTRNEGRVRALEKMRKERRKRREADGLASIKIQGAETSGKLVFTVENVSHQYDSRSVIKNFSTVIMRGDKIGLVGPNGAGKTTLLNIMLGNLEPVSGSVRLGTKLKAAYFDQTRAALDEEKSVRENVAFGSDSVILNGVSRHVVGYLQDFLFTPERAMTPVKRLSGGERNRLLLARLFSKPSNLLVLDEPTNDLDEETLALLEERLLEYEGTVLLVSHDRAFLNNVVTSTLVFEGGGRIVEYAGGYDDWVKQRISLKEDPGGFEKRKKREKRAKSSSGKVKKLTFKELKELESIPDVIETLENEQNEIFSKLADPEFYKEGGGCVSSEKERLAAVEEELNRVYSRWEELDSLTTD